LIDKHRVRQDDKMRPVPTTDDGHGRSPTSSASVRRRHPNRRGPRPTARLKLLAGGTTGCERSMTPRSAASG
jgi:hypothetical protein